ncbi:MAG: hypothetical protein ACI38A_07160 [Candidatus Ornithomonoglobus sp.]
MIYINPEIKITMFDMETVRTGENGEPQSLAPVSGNYNDATRSLQDSFAESAGSASKVLVFKWE